MVTKTRPGIQSEVHALIHAAPHGQARLQTTLVYLEILPDPSGHRERVP